MWRNHLKAGRGGQSARIENAVSSGASVSGRSGDLASSVGVPSLRRGTIWEVDRSEESERIDKAVRRSVVVILNDLSRSVDSSRYFDIGNGDVDRRGGRQRVEKTTLIECTVDKKTYD